MSKYPQQSPRRSRQRNQPGGETIFFNEEPIPSTGRPRHNRQQSYEPSNPYVRPRSHSQNRYYYNESSSPLSTNRRNYRSQERQVFRDSTDTRASSPRNGSRTWTVPTWDPYLGTRRSLADTNVAYSSEPPIVHEAVQVKLLKEEAPPSPPVPPPVQEEARARSPPKKKMGRVARHFISLDPGYIISLPGICEILSFIFFMISMILAVTPYQRNPEFAFVVFGTLFGWVSAGVIFIVKFCLAAHQVNIYYRIYICLHLSIVVAAGFIATVLSSGESIHGRKRPNDIAMAVFAGLGTATSIIDLAYNATAYFN